MIQLNPEALAMEEIDIMGSYYKKSHVVDKDDQTMYGYEASTSFSLYGTSTFITSVRMGGRGWGTQEEVKKGCYGLLRPFRSDT